MTCDRKDCPNRPYEPTQDELLKWIDDHYSHIMSQWQRDQVKLCIAGHETTDEHPACKAWYRKLIRQARAVVSAGHSV